MQQRLVELTEVRMRRALVALTALSLCLPALAQAQRFERGRGEQNASQAQPEAVGPQGRPQADAPDRKRSRHGGPSGRVAPKQDAAPQNRRDPNVAENRERRDLDRRDVDRDRRDDRDRGREFRGDRGRGDARRYFNYRGREYAAVRGPDFRYPRGWGYRHWNRGEVLPRLFLASPFFFEYGYLGLPPPPRDFRWVRYGPDALLVNSYDGRIVDVIYDAFY